MSTDRTRSIERYFSRFALRYHAHASLQQRIAIQLIQRFSLLQEPESILEIGCGSGFLTRPMRARFPQAIIEAFDLSPEMLAIVRSQNLPGENRFFVADMNTYQASRKFDIVASSTALHWANSLSEIMQRLSRFLVPGGKLFAAIMSSGTLCELHSIRQELFPQKTPRRKLPTEVTIATSLKNAAWQNVVVATETWTENYSSVQALFRTLHNTGFTGGGFALPAKDRLVRSELSLLSKQYQKAHGDAAGMVQATYCVTFVEATAGCDLPTVKPKAES